MVGVSLTATVQPITSDKSMEDFGAIITGVDVENLSGKSI